MDVRQLRYYVAVARERNFTRAAQLLHIAQPALSRQIQQIEEELGVALLERGGRQLVLTAAGTYLFERAQHLLEELDVTVATTCRIGHKQRKKFEVGFSLMTLHGQLPELIRKFGSSVPHMEIGFCDLSSTQQFEALRTGRIDVGFGRFSCQEDDICSEVVLREALAVAMPRGNPLVDMARPSVADVASQPYILYPATPRPRFADFVLDIFHARKLAPIIRMQANSLHAAIAMVSAGFGVTLVPKSMQDLHLPGVAYREIAERDLCSPVYMSVRRNDPAPELLLLKECVASLVSS